MDISLPKEPSRQVKAVRSPSMCPCISRDSSRPTECVTICYTPCLQVLELHPFSIEYKRLMWLKPGRVSCLTLGSALSGFPGRVLARHLTCGLKPAFLSEAFLEALCLYGPHYRMMRPSVETGQNRPQTPISNPRVMGQ